MILVIKKLYFFIENQGLEKKTIEGFVSDGKQVAGGEGVLYEDKEALVSG